MIQQFKSKQFLVFLITGGFAAAVNFFSRIFYSQWLDFSHAIISAYLTGMITAFILAKLFVFKDGQKSLHQSAFYFVLINLLAVFQTWIFSMVLFHHVLPFFGVKFLAQEIAHAVGVVIPVFTSYIGHKHLSFK